MAAYIGVPLINFLEKKGINRGISSFLLGIFYYAVLFVMGFLFFFSLKALYNFFVLQWTDHGPMVQEKFSTMVDLVYKDADPMFKHGLEQALNDGIRVIKNFLISMMMNGVNTMQNAALLLFAPVISFYLMKDWAHIWQRFFSLIPPQYQEKALLWSKEIHQSMEYYIYGQFSVCLFLGFYYAVALKILGLPWSIVIGLLTGLFSFIPYVGFLFSLTTSLILVWFSWGTLPGILWVFCIYLLGYALEALVFVPSLIGKRTGLHPVWVLFAVLLGGTLKGFLGVFIALPMATFLGACWRLFRHEYRQIIFHKEQ